MDTRSTEQALRQEAVRRYLQGERPCDISRDLKHTTRWLEKWRHEFVQHPDTDFADHSRAPHTSPHRIAPEIERAVVAVRKAREAGRTLETRYGLIGQSAVLSDLERLQIHPLPSLASIQRIMAQHGLTHPLGAAQDTAYYPWLIAWAPNAIHATDIITRHLRGGVEIQNFHTIDQYSLAVHLSQQVDKTSPTACAHLLETWADLGLPGLQQFDNEGAFSGGHTHARIIGRVVRLCLFCGVAPLFIPEYEAKRNHWIETFHSIWLKGFWSRRIFRSFEQVRREAPTFVRWYYLYYRPPSLAGRTPAQMRAGYQPHCLTPALRALIPPGKLPITAGQIHILRKVDAQGMVPILNEMWPVGKKWIGEYVWAILDTGEQTLDFWHLPELPGSWIHIRTRSYHLNEPVEALLPEFWRNSERCHEHLPG